MSVGNSVFGVPLSDATPPDCDLPLVLIHCLDFLAEFAIPAPSDLFSREASPEVLASLMEPFTLDMDPDAPSPFTGRHNATPYTVASLLTHYLQCLPEPIVPQKFFYTYVALNGLKDPRLRVMQLRVLTRLLPIERRETIFSLCDYLSESQLPEELTAAMFSPFFFAPPPLTREGIGFTPDNPSVYRVPQTILNAVTSTFIHEVHYFMKVVIDPLADVPSPAPFAPMRCPDSFVLQADALYVFAGSDVLLALEPGRVVRVHDIKIEDGWLRGSYRRQSGYFPETYVRIRPIQPSPDADVAPTTRHTRNRSASIHVMSPRKPAKTGAESTQSKLSESCRTADSGAAATLRLPVAQKTPVGRRRSSSGSDGHGQTHRSSHTRRKPDEKKDSKKYSKDDDVPPPPPPLEDDDNDDVPPPPPPPDSDDEKEESGKTTAYYATCKEVPQLQIAGNVTNYDESELAPTPPRHIALSGRYATFAAFATAQQQQPVLFQVNFADEEQPSQHGSNAATQKDTAQHSTCIPPPASNNDSPTATGITGLDVIPPPPVHRSRSSSHTKEKASGKTHSHRAPQPSSPNSSSSSQETEQERINPPPTAANDIGPPPLPACDSDASPRLPRVSHTAQAAPGDPTENMWTAYGLTDTAASSLTKPGSRASTGVIFTGPSSAFVPSPEASPSRLGSILQPPPVADSDIGPPPLPADWIPPPPLQQPAAAGGDGSVDIGPPKTGAWMMNVPAEDMKKLRKLLVGRETRAKQLLSSEEVYLEFLKVMMNCFIEPLRKDPMGLSKEDVMRMFGNVEVLLKCHTELLGRIRAAMKDWNDDSCVAEAFNKGLGFTRIYAFYVTNYASNSDAAKECCEKSPRFCAYLASIENMEPMRGLSLSAFLVAPVQRIMRYSMLLDEILICTPQQHPDYEPLRKATQNMKDIASFVNERKRGTENMKTFKDFIASLSEFTGNDTIDVNGRTHQQITTMQSRLLIRKGPAVCNKEKVQLTLFSDVLFVCKPGRHDKLYFKKLFHLNNNLILAGADVTSIRVVPEGRGTETVFTFSDEAETHEWFAALHSASEEEHDRLASGPNLAMCSSSSFLSDTREKFLEKRRKDVFFKFVDTEAEFCKNSLGVLWNRFLNPLISSSTHILVNSETTEMAANYVGKLYEYHQALLNSVTARRDEYQTNSNLSDITMWCKDLLEFYKTYILHVDEMKAAISKARSEKEAFNRWITNIELCEHAEINELFERPLHRPIEIFISFADMLNSTPHTHPDYHALSASLVPLKTLKEDISKTVNERVSMQNAKGKKPK